MPFLLFKYTNCPAPDARLPWRSSMPSFDVVSELNMHEVTNAVDQAIREIQTRFDLRGTKCRFVQDKNVVTPGPKPAKTSST